MNNLRYAFRFLSRQKAFSIINILGLALSLASCIVMSRYLYREVTVDSHVIDGETVCEIVEAQTNVHITLQNWPNDFRETLLSHVSERCLCIGAEKMDVELDSSMFFGNIIFADSTYLHFFDLKVTGDRNALSTHDAVLMSRHYADQFFGSEPLGQTFKIANSSYRIAGIFEEPDCKQSFKGDILMPLELFGKEINPAGIFPMVEWLRMSSVSDIGWANSQLMGTNFRLVHPAESYREHSNRKPRCENMMPVCNPSAIKILTVVDILILLIGLFNFVNIYMVLLQRRHREWAVRKVFGQTPWRLFRQIWMENMIQILAAILIAWLVVELSNEFTNQLLEDKFSYSWFDLRLTLYTLLFVPVLATIYPMIQSLIQPPVATIRCSAAGKESIRTRLAFLAFQYLLTLCILVCALWAKAHFSFLLQKSEIVSTERVMFVQINHTRSLYSHFSQVTVVQKAIRQCPLLEDVDTENGARLIFENWSQDIATTRDDRKYKMMMNHCTRKLFSMYDIEILEGIDPTDPALTEEDFDDKHYCYVNETAWKMFGFENLEDAYIYHGPDNWPSGIQQPPSLDCYMYRHENGDYDVKYWGTPDNPVKIRGIVQDYYSGHVTQGIQPIIFVCNMQNPQDNLFSIGASYILKPYAGKEKELISFLEDLHQEQFGNTDFEWHWMQQEIDDLYRDDRRLSRVFNLFSAIAIVICCLGLFGLSLFDIRLRYREVAIRKAHGAHRRDLYLLLGKKYLYLLLITFVLCIPVTYVLIHHYTESFVESAPLTPWLYLFALVIVLTITALTLMYQLERAARVNVAKVVKSE